MLNSSERAGPGNKDLSSILWLYHSHRNEAKDTNSGLIGPIIVYRKGQLQKSSARPLNIDHEFVLLFTIYDETQSWYPQEKGSISKLYTINGHINNTLKGLWMWQQEHVRWHVAGVMLSV